MNQYMAIFDSVLKGKTPKSNQLMKKIDVFIKKLEKIIKNKRLKAQVKLGGSVAKGTYLADDFDCDIFVRFDKDYDNLSNLLEDILSDFIPNRIHGSRDYFQLTLDKINYEIVPVLNINNPILAQNVTDCSPLHVDWIQKKINKDKNLQKEILLTKLFTKSIGVYGAESYIGGFSGHVLDILVTKYNTFLKLLESSSGWGKSIIDVEKHKVNAHFDSPLIVIDPIQPNRNASAALTKEKLALFKKKAKAFLDSPDKSYFTKKKFDLDTLKKQKDIIILKATPKEGKKDVVGGKLFKVYKMILKQLKEFDITKSGWSWESNYCYFWYVYSIDRIPSTFIRTGPPKNAKEGYQKFLSKHKNAYEKDARLYATIKRKKTKIVPFIDEVIGDKYIKEKIVDITYV